MSREVSYNAIILKRQPLGEADEIITLFTDSLGKVRLKSSATKFSTSKLAPGLQPGFLVKATAAGGGPLRKLIRVEARQAFPLMHQNSGLIRAWFVIAELVLKSTPDEEANPSLFTALVDCLDSIEARPGQVRDTLLQFKIRLLQAVGFGIPSASLAVVAPDRLHDFVDDFVVYQLERPIKSQQFLEENISLMSNI